MRFGAVLLAVLLSVSLAGCGDDAGDTTTTAADITYDCEPLGETLQCRARPLAGSIQVDSQERPTEFTYDWRRLQELNESEFGRILAAQQSDEFVPILDPDMMRQMRLWTQQPNTATLNQVENLLQTTTRTLRCRFHRGPKGIPVPICS